MTTVLFVCLQNAGGSQMSQALFTHAAHGTHQALSAGATPAPRVHPEVIEVMRELDIDLSDRTPQHLTSELAEQADIVVTMGCGDAAGEVAFRPSGSAFLVRPQRRRVKLNRQRDCLSGPWPRTVSGCRSTPSFLRLGQ